MSEIQDRIIREVECKQITGISRVSRWRMEQRGDFPRRLQLSEQSVGWRLSEVNEWLSSLGTSRDKWDNRAWLPGQPKSAGTT